jgi:hypothetical protein
MPDPASLGDFIDDVDPLLPQNIPAADIALVINVHPDILFGLLPKLKEVGVKGIIGGSESPRELPLGQRKQLGNGAGDGGGLCQAFLCLPTRSGQAHHRQLSEKGQNRRSDHRIFLAEEPGRKVCYLGR